MVKIMTSAKCFKASRVAKAAKDAKTAWAAKASRVPKTAMFTKSGRVPKAPMAVRFAEGTKKCSKDTKEGTPVEFSANNVFFKISTNLCSMEFEERTMFTLGRGLTGRTGCFRTLATAW